MPSNNQLCTEGRALGKLLSTIQTKTFSISVDCILLFSPRRLSSRTEFSPWLHSYLLFFSRPVFSAFSVYFCISFVFLFTLCQFISSFFSVLVFHCFIFIFIYWYQHKFHFLSVYFVRSITVFRGLTNKNLPHTILLSFVQIKATTTKSSVSNPNQKPKWNRIKLTIKPASNLMKYNWKQPKPVNGGQWKN